MFVGKSIILILVLCAVSLPAAAWDGVEVVEAEGYITRWVAYESTPTPGYCNWSTEDIPVQSFHVTNADATEGNDCTDPWYVHCDEDSLSFHGEWPALDASNMNSTNYELTLTCTVNVSVLTGAVAVRAVTGNLDLDNHSLTVEDIYGTVFPILSPGTGPDETGMVLNPGTYVITLDVYSKQSTAQENSFDPYSGYVALIWEDPANVPTEPTSWGAMKAIFR